MENSRHEVIQPSMNSVNGSRTVISKRWALEPKWRYSVGSAIPAKRQISLVVVAL